MKKWKKTLCRVLAMCFLLASMVVAGGTVAEAKSGKWKHDSKGYYYAFSDGTYAKNQWVLVQNKYYHFDSKGYMQTGWLKLDGKWYYLNPVKGFMSKGWTRISGSWYYFNPKGVMLTGWNKLGGKWYYMNSKGVMQTGWQKISGKWYYFDASGVWIKNKAQSSTVKKINVGDTISFGSYEQDNDSSSGKESIEWLVLDKQGNQYLLISKYVLDCQVFSKHKVNTAWETSPIRQWLNEDFYKSAFTEADRAKILSKTIPADDNTGYGVKAGNATTDKIFFLSVTEIARYFNLRKVQNIGSPYVGDSCVAKPTASALAAGVKVETYRYSSYKGNAIYWLRTPGSTTLSTSYVTSDGMVYANGTYSESTNVGVRPAMWVTID